MPHEPGHSFDIQNIDYSTLIGAGQPQNLEEIIGALGQLLMTGGYMGAQYGGSGATPVTFGAQQQASEGGGGYGYTQAGWGAGPEIPSWGEWDERGEYNIDNIIASLKHYGTNPMTDPTWTDTKWTGGMGQLGNLLEYLDIPGMQKQYSQDVGSIGSEITAQIGGLQKAHAVGGKEQRYGNIVEGGKAVGPGGRQRYLSDYYGLHEKQFEMEEDLRKELEKGFTGDIGQWMGMYKA